MKCNGVHFRCVTVSALFTLSVLFLQLRTVLCADLAVRKCQYMTERCGLESFDIMYIRSRNEIAVMYGNN